MFSDPVYGGNKNFAGWNLIGYYGVKMPVTAADQKIGAKVKAAHASGYGGGELGAYPKAKKEAIACLTSSAPARSRSAVARIVLAALRSRSQPMLMTWVAVSARGQRRDLPLWTMNCSLPISEVSAATQRS